MPDVELDTGEARERGAGLIRRAVAYIRRAAEHLQDDVSDDETADALRLARDLGEVLADEIEAEPMLDLDLIEARAKAATLGPWLTYKDDRGWAVVGDTYDWPSITGGDGMMALPNAGHDATFIAASRTDVPALVAEVRRRSFEKVVLIDDHTELEMKLSLMQEEARLWRALARARSKRGIPMIEGAGEELRRRADAEAEAITGLSALGLDPDAMEPT